VKIPEYDILSNSTPKDERWLETVGFGAANENVRVPHFRSSQPRFLKHGS